MIYNDFDALKKAALGGGARSACAVVMAQDEHTLEAVMLAQKDGFIQPILIGDVAKIKAILEKLSLSAEGAEMVEAASVEEALALAVKMVHDGKAQILMKGLLQTSDFMRALVKRDNQLKTGSLISMLSLRKFPNYHKVIAMTDTGICECPTLEQKKELIQNAVDTLTAMGFDHPKVAALAAAETVNPRMTSSTDAEELQKMNERGEITGCTVAGPISIDLAISKEAAEIKGYNSPVAGDADLLLFPDLAAANIAGKLVAEITGTPAGVMILGTKVPAIVCSRSATVETKHLCIALAAARK